MVGSAYVQKLLRPRSAKHSREDRRCSMLPVLMAKTPSVRLNSVAYAQVLLSGVEVCMQHPDANRCNLEKPGRTQQTAAPLGQNLLPCSGFQLGALRCR